MARARGRPRAENPRRRRITYVLTEAEFRRLRRYQRMLPRGLRESPHAAARHVLIEFLNAEGV